MDALKSLVHPFVGGSGVGDGIKLVLLGGTVETARRMSSTAWNTFVNSFFLTAHFSSEDDPYEWLMLWLSKRPEWHRSREFETKTISNTLTNDNFVVDYDVDDDDDRHDYDDTKPRTTVIFQPTCDTTHTIYYKGHWLRVTRGRTQADSWGYSNDLLTISVVARNNSILKQLIIQAKREYEAQSVHRVQIYVGHANGWRWSDSRHKRPMSSIVLSPGLKEMLVEDTKDFLRSEKWYADRGIPFRRGYLLHGVPGSGKTSLIHALAGELGLDIYVVSLSSSWMTDDVLTNLLGRVPNRCILLLEDLDAAFTRDVSRGPIVGPKTKEETEENSEETKDGEKKKRKRHNGQLSATNTLSLSGLLNSLDGVVASEGRLLFATTNHLNKLDPALSRPGRMDVWVEFKNATQWQAERLFRNFFPRRPSSALPKADDSDLLSNDIRSLCNDGTPSVITSKEQLNRLSKQFADSIPDDEFSVASLQGYLLKHKSFPERAASGAAAWVVSEREMRTRLAAKKEKERKEKRAKARAEKKRKAAEQKAKKEVEAKATEEKKKAEEAASQKQQSSDDVGDDPVKVEKEDAESSDESDSDDEASSEEENEAESQKAKSKDNESDGNSDSDSGSF
ncbi:P-loop containing nucleoside triphosphate hydrolase protein [Fistulina hepatica ATCC 64428]|nr:P-loop containing nucleoside triphosphate hydrolase protein [Fistulina hepatica ATCC 64428]